MALRCFFIKTKPPPGLVGGGLGKLEGNRKERMRYLYVSYHFFLKKSSHGFFLKK